MGQEVQARPQSQAIQIRDTVQTIKARVQLVQHVMRDVMRNGIHYGTIPGTPKPILFKPGAEVMGLAFRLAPRYITEDLGCLPELVRYRTTCELYHQETGAFIGSGQGEGSSDEEKYRWRKAVGPEEFEAAPEDRRRIKWAKGQGGSTYTINQVRIEPADVANTVLKQTEKRAFVAAIRTATGCSDMFAQDLEEMPSEVRQALGDEEEQVSGSKPIGQKDWRKLVAQGKRFGYTTEDVLATAATAGYEGPGPEMPEDLAQRLYEAMKNTPKSAAPETPEEASGSAPAERSEDPPSGYRTPMVGGDHD